MGIFTREEKPQEPVRFKYFTAPKDEVAKKPVTKKRAIPKKAAKKKVVKERGYHSDTKHDHLDRKPSPLPKKKK